MSDDTLESHHNNERLHNRMWVLSQLKLRKLISNLDGIHDEQEVCRWKNVSVYIDMISRQSTH